MGALDVALIFAQKNADLGAGAQPS
jgi:hypothetical protein